MESKTSDLDARHKFQEITHQRAKLQNLGQGAYSDPNSWSAWAEALGALRAVPGITSSVASKPTDLPKTDLPCIWGLISSFLIPNPYHALLESVNQCCNGLHPGSLLPDTHREGSQSWPCMSFPFPEAGIR